MLASSLQAWTRACRITSLILAVIRESGGLAVGAMYRTSMWRQSPAHNTARRVHSAGG